MRRHFLFTLVLISTLAVQSQNFIRGKVLDDNNQPIRGPYVILKQTSRCPTAQTARNPAPGSSPV